MRCNECWAFKLSEFSLLFLFSSDLIRNAESFCTVLPQALKATKFFQTTELDWVEVGLQVCRQVRAAPTTFP